MAPHIACATLESIAFQSTAIQAGGAVVSELPDMWEAKRHFLPTMAPARAQELMDGRKDAVLCSR